MATGGSALEIRLTVRTVAVVLVSIVAAFVIQAMFMRAHRIISWAVAATIVAVVLEPIIATLDRWLPRWLAVITSLGGVMIVAVVLWGATVASLRTSVGDLRNEAPRAAASLEARYEIARDFRLSDRVDDLIDNLETPSARSTVGKAAGTASTYFVSGILMLFLLAYGPKITDGALALVTPESRQRRYADVLARTLARGRRYVVTIIEQLLAITAVVGFVAWRMELPAPMLLGLIAGALGCLPTLGILAGSLPAILMAGGFGSLKRGAVMLLIALVLQLAESFGVQRFTQRFVRVGPALPGIVALLAFEIYGIGAAVYGFIILVFLVAFFDTIGDPYDAGGAPAVPAA